MRNRALLILSIFLIGWLASGHAQPKQKDAKQKEMDFARDKPAVGDDLPDLTVYSPNGKEVKLSSLKGHFTVLTFGCLT